MTEHKFCYHCNEVIPPFVNLTLAIQNKERSFCCKGCLALTQWILDENLGQYYRMRTGAPKADKAYLERFVHYDLPEIYQKYCKNERGLTSTTLIVEDIHCAACIWLIEKALLRQSGIKVVEGNATTYVFKISWFDDQIKLSTILGEIYRLGYTPILGGISQSISLIQKNRRQKLKHLIVAGLGMMQVMMYSAGLYAGDWHGMDAGSRALLEWVSFLITTPVYFYAGLPFVKSAISAIKSRHLNMDVPVALAITLAYGFSTFHLLAGQGSIYFDSVVMFIFFLSASRYLEMMARYKAVIQSHQASAVLPEIVHKAENDSVIIIPIDGVKEGDLLWVKAGDIIPCDGEIIRGQTSVNESLLTGEDRSIEKDIGSTVYAGTLNQEQSIQFVAKAVNDDTVLSKTKALLNEVMQQKSTTLVWVDKLASYLVAFILSSTLIAYLVWAFILGSPNAFEIALSVLVATCPCALSLSVPTAYAAASNSMAMKKVYIKNNRVFDAIHHLSSIVFDKTGTLTTNELKIDNVSLYQSEVSNAEALAIAAALETHIHHPIATVFTPYRHQDYVLESQTIHIGKGVSGQVNGHCYYLGSSGYISSILGQNLETGFIYLSTKTVLLASFNMVERSSNYAKEAVSRLGHYQLYIASGDSLDRVKKVADTLGIEQYEGGLSPSDKLNFVVNLKNQQKTVMMIGDGINDAPVLAGADISLAIGEASTLSKAQADIVVGYHDLRCVPFFINLAKKTKRIVRQNLTWSICYNLTAVPFALLGYLPPWLAALGMSLSSLFVLLNALRLYINKKGYGS